MGSVFLLPLLSSTIPGVLVVGEEVAGLGLAQAASVHEQKAIAHNSLLFDAAAEGGHGAWGDAADLAVVPARRHEEQRRQRPFRRSWARSEVSGGVCGGSCGVGFGVENWSNHRDCSRDEAYGKENETTHKERDNVQKKNLPHKNMASLVIQSMLQAQVLKCQESSNS
jgi:hypothetical protein